MLITLSSVIAFLVPGVVANSSKDREAIDVWLTTMLDPETQSINGFLLSGFGHIDY